MPPACPTLESPLPRTSAPGSRYGLLAMLCAAAAISYLQRSGMSVAVKKIPDELPLDKTQLGAVMSAWSAGYAAAQIPSGWLADRWGSRRALTFFALLWSVATGLVGAAHGYVSLLIIWTAMGVAQAGIFPCSSRAISRAFESARRASASGLLASSMGVGGALAPALTGVLLVTISWRWVFALYALPGILWAILFYLWIRDEPPAIAPAESAPRLAGEADVWRAIAASPSMWLLCGQQFFRAAAMIFFLTWFPTFLVESRGVTLQHASYLTTLVGIGVVAGAVPGGFCSDKLLVLTGNRRLSRQGIAVAGMSACAALIVGADFIADVTVSVSVISLAAFCASFGGVSGYVVAMDLGGRRIATVFSIMNTCGNIGAAALPVVVGWLVKRSGNWNLMLFAFAGIFAVDAVCWALLNPREPLFPEEVKK
jgi:sugar phosphate permease